MRSGRLGADNTVTAVHALQLLPSFDSGILPITLGFSLLTYGGRSAQARTYIVPAERVIDFSATALALVTSIDISSAITWSATPEASLVAESYAVAVWNLLVKPIPVEALPPFVILELKVTGPAVAVVGEI